MLKSIRYFRQYLTDTRGAAAMEYGLTLPAMIALLVGGLEIGYLSFANVALEGAVRDASRLGLTGLCNMEQPRDQVIGDLVTGRMTDFPTIQTVEVEPLVYDSFADIGEPEPFDDLNLNAAWDPGEPYQDLNGNGSYDTDMGVAGLGGPGAVVLYRVAVEIRPLTALFDQVFSRANGGPVMLRAATAVRNEPFGLVDVSGQPSDCGQEATP